MPEGDTIHRAARRIAGALVGEEIVAIETPQPQFARRPCLANSRPGHGDDNRATYWCPGCQR